LQITRIGALGAIVLAGGLALAGCASTPSTTPTGDTSPTASSAASGLDAIDPSLKGTLTAGGSSAQANAETAWAAAFNSVASGLVINYDKSQGSGGGRTNFISGAYDFAGSDAPLSADETTKAAATYPSGAVDLPIYLDGVSVAYNVAGVTKLNLATETIAKIFAGQITDWSDAAITADNGGTALPAGKITVVVRSDSSGTAQNFTNFLAASAPDVWTWPGSGTFPADIAGTDAQKGGGAVHDEIAKVAGSIGYLDHSAVGDLASATVNGVAPTADAVAAAYSAGATVKSNGVAGDLSIVFDYAKINADTAAYPIPLLSYAIIPLEFKDPAQAKLTVAYLQFVASEDGQKAAAAKANSVPLPAEILAQVNATLATVR